MKNVLMSLAISIFASSVAYANVTPVCKEGDLPAIFHGTYDTQSSNTLIRLTANKLYFEGFQGAYFVIHSCVINNKQVITLTDNEPSSTENLYISKLQDGNLHVEDLETGETATWTLIK